MAKHKENGEELAERPSRSAKKRASTALQKLGEDLATLTPAQREELNLPDDLRQALTVLDGLTDHEAARRQRQYIGRLMRELADTGLPDAIARALERRNA